MQRTVAKCGLIIIYMAVELEDVALRESPPAEW
jgi:hypothetical protein